jgi:hypothetical protein
LIVTGGASADSSVPPASGQNTGGADVNGNSSGATAPDASGQGVGGADTNGNSSDSSVPTASGQNTGGADTASLSDTTPPVISAMDNISTSTDGTSVIVNYTSPSATDAVDGPVTSVCVPESGSSFNVGTTQVTCTATDAANNSASTTFDVIVTNNPVTEKPSPYISSGGGVSPSSRSGSYSSGGSSIIPLLALSSTNGTTTPILTCPLITTYMKFGGINNPTDVAKLQVFLKNSQGLDVTVNGIFDQQMENAVRAFQSKYMSQIMGPWGATQSSGYVYITTLKKVNEIACNTPLTLNLGELTIINAYKNQQIQNGQTTPGTLIIPGTLNIPGTTNTGTTAPTPLIGQNGTSSNANVAAVGSFAGTWNNFWGSVWKSITKIF